MKRTSTVSPNPYATPTRSHRERSRPLTSCGMRNRIVVPNPVTTLLLALSHSTRTEQESLPRAFHVLKKPKSKSDRTFSAVSGAHERFLPLTHTPPSAAAPEGSLAPPRQPLRPSAETPRSLNEQRSLCRT